MVNQIYSELQNNCFETENYHQFQEINIFHFLLRKIFDEQYSQDNTIRTSPWINLMNRSQKIKTYHQRNINYNFMQQLKQQYFDNLVQSNSPRSQNLSSELASSNLQKMINSNNFIVNTTPSPRKSSDPSKVKIKKYKIKTQPNMQRLKELSQMKPHKNDLSRVKSEDDAIQQYEELLKLIKKKREHYENVKPDPSKHLKKIKIEKQIVSCIRKQQQLQKEIQYQKDIKAQRLEIEERQNEEKKEKKQAISKRMKKLEQHRQERQEILSSKSLPTLPKYKLMEKMFLMEQLKWELDKKVQSRRLHEVRYKDYMKHDYKDDQKSCKEIKRIKTEVASQRKLDEKQIQERRKQMIFLLEEKRKHRSIKVNPESSHKFDIVKDKSQNPQKYHFLKLKNLTDQQIYKDFKDFEPNYDYKILGNQYLEQSKAVLKKQESSNTFQRSRVQSNKSIGKSINHIADNISERENRKFIQSSRLKNKSIVYNHPKIDPQNKQKQEILRILRGSESKSKVIELLSKESLTNIRSITELEDKMTKEGQYHELLKIENSIDSEYLQFLKAKIVALGLQLN